MQICIWDLLTDLRSNTYLVLGHKNLTDTLDTKHALKHEQRSDIYPSTHMGTHTAWFNPFTQFASSVFLRPWKENFRRSTRALQFQCVLSSGSGFIGAVGLRAICFLESKQAIMGLASHSTVHLSGADLPNQGKPGCCFDVLYFRSVEIKKKPWKDATTRTASNLGVCSHRMSKSAWGVRVQGFPSRVLLYHALVYPHLLVNASDRGTGYFGFLSPCAT